MLTVSTIFHTVVTVLQCSNLFRASIEQLVGACNLVRMLLGFSAHMGYLQSSLIHPPNGEQILGTPEALFKPSVPLHIQTSMNVRTYQSSLHDFRPLSPPPLNYKKNMSTWISYVTAKKLQVFYFLRSTLDIVVDLFRKFNWEHENLGQLIAIYSSKLFRKNLEILSKMNRGGEELGALCGIWGQSFTYFTPLDIFINLPQIMKNAFLRKLTD